MRAKVTLLIACLTLAAAGASARQSQVTAIVPLESYLEALRVQVGIPGMSAALVQEGRIVWERGFGFQNHESRIRATPDTPYPIADLSQTVASVLLLQCAEQRRLNLDDPIRRHGSSVDEQGATIRQLMNHTSASNGEVFHYDPDRYSRLTQVVEACIPQPYRKSVAVSILERLAMKDSVPGRDLTSASVLPEPLFASEVLERYRKVLDRVAVGYKVDKRGRLTRTELEPEAINAASGLVSTVRDLARFDAALDREILVHEEMLALAWSPSSSTAGATLPMGLGWFVQSYRGEPVVWHFGNITNAYSSLVVKLPARDLTLILLANSDGLSAPFELDAGDVTKSVFATLFLRLST